MDREDVAGQAAPTPGPNPQAGFQAFWKDHYRHFLRLLMSTGATEQDAQDAIVEVMANMVAKKTWVTLTTNPKAWVDKALRSRYCNRRKRERDRPEREHKACHVTIDLCIDPNLNVWEDQEWVTQMLNTLPPAQREVLELTLQELKPTEIADLLGKSPEAIRQNLAHARRRLLANLGKDYRVDPVSRPASAPRKEGTP